MSRRGYAGIMRVDDGADRRVLHSHWRSALSNRLTATLLALGVLAGHRHPFPWLHCGVGRHVLGRANQWSASGVCSFALIRSEHSPVLICRDCW